MSEQTISNPYNIMDADIEHITQFIIAQGNARKSHMTNCGEDFNEADYLCGAMATFHALGIQSHIPMMWTIGIMAGRTPFSTLIPQSTSNAISKLIELAESDDDSGTAPEDYYTIIDDIKHWFNQVKSIPEPDKEW